MSDAELSKALEIEAERDQLRIENGRLRAALDAVAGFGSVNLAGEYEGGLRDIIRSMTDCARRALEQSMSDFK